MKIRKFLVLLPALLISLSCSAMDFFSSDAPDQLFNFGVRMGINTSNSTVSDKVVAGYNVNGWGTGFDIGAVCDINFRDYLSLQPGFFYQSRSNNFSYTFPGAEASGETFYLTQLGHFRSYHFNIPVLASVHFNITKDIRWDMDFGPYLSFCLGSSRNNKSLLSTGDFGDVLVPFSSKPKSVDFGFKMGTGLRILRNYYVGIHYMAGALGAWKDMKYENFKMGCGGRNKAWTFTLGYYF